MENLTIDKGAKEVMPNRVIKESIWTSPNMNMLSAEGERHFYRCLMTTDDFGCFEATPLVIKGRCYPLQPKITEKDILRWNEELSNSDLVRFWDDDLGPHVPSSAAKRKYGIFLNFSKHQRVRAKHQRKTPEPPVDIFRHVTTNDGECPPNLNLNPNPINILSGKKDARPFTDICKEIIDDLNAVSGKNFDYRTKSTQALIHARINEGRTVEDFFVVHRNKESWRNDPEQGKYLRPETLYAARHFESYLNETPVPEPEAWRY